MKLEAERLIPWERECRRKESEQQPSRNLY
jgi:hypothetical protein